MAVTVTYDAATLELTTSMTDVYQCPDNAGTVALITDLSISNIDGTNSATFQLVRTASDNTILSYLGGKDNTVPAPMALDIVKGLKVLKRGQKIRALASANGDLSLDISVRVEVTT